jgi:hypothetical protein
MERINLAQYPQIEEIIDRLILKVSSIAGKWRWQPGEFSVSDYDSYLCIRGASSVYGLEILMIPGDGKPHRDKFRFTLKGKTYFADADLCKTSVGLQCLEEMLVTFYNNLVAAEKAKNEDEKKREVEKEGQRLEEEGKELVKALEDL